MVGLSLATLVRVNALLDATWNARDVETFLQAVYREMQKIFVFDCAAAFIVERGEGSLQVPPRMISWDMDSEFVSAYVGYYHTIDPVRAQFSPELTTSTVDWSHYRDTEFVADFISRIGIRHSMWTFIEAPCIAWSVGFGVMRDNGRPFEKTEEQTYGMVGKLLEKGYCHLALAREDSVHFRPAEIGCGAMPLSRRELQVAELLCQRRPMSEIAKLLGIGVRTVETHAEHIYEKLGIAGRHELCTLLLRRTSEVDAT